ncbi:MAG: hypothetical protein OXH82_05065 [Candidatus Dadabacteria bacterium]|nr:hypothetical protein [Candidatus Dadabacteria bacterium]MDE0663277.1 hypothetical protein [Candidatus Dadabacteria bacterium]
MKQLLLVATLSISVWPISSFAGDPPTPGNHSSKTAVISQPAEASGANVKVFIHPDTGEILAREQWEALGIENDETETIPHSSSSESPETEDTQTILKGKKIDLENGDYVIVVDALDMVETKAWFDEEGKAHIRCNH